MKRSGQGSRRTDPLYRLIYVSRIAPAVRTHLDGAVRDILAVSGTRNAATEVTGLLLVTSQDFAQALEGPQSAVERLYDRIKSDARHMTPRVVVQGPIEQRVFERWSMCAPQLSPDDLAMVGQLEARSGFDPAKLTDTALLGLLQAIGRVQSAREDARQPVYL